MQQMNDDCLLDTLGFLDRPNLDLARFTNRRFSCCIETRMQMVCLRTVKKVTVISSSISYEAPTHLDWYALVYVSIKGSRPNFSHECKILVKISFTVAAFWLYLISNNR